MKRLLIILGISLGVFFVSCRLDNEGIQNQQWKYTDGYHIGDVLRFDPTKFIISNDSISRDGKLVAIIEETTSRMGKTSDILIIRNPQDGKIGRYVTF